jgi:hypothetical protein
MSDLYGFDGTLWRRVLVDVMGRLVVVGGGGGGGVGITDTDDNSLAAGQTTLLSIDENYVFDSVAGIWIRLQGGVDNAVGPAAPQVSFVGGIVTDPEDVFADGDTCGLHFDTRGRLLTSVVRPGTVITSPADTALPAGTVPLPVPPVGTTRMTVQVTGGSATTQVRIRELGGAAGTGVLLTLLGSRVYGADGGSIAPLEAELTAGAAAAVAIQFEG